MSSFRDIQQDCEIIVKDLIECLKDHFRDPKVNISFARFKARVFQAQKLNYNANLILYLLILQSTPKQLTECVDLLLQLKEPPNELCDEYLAQ